MIPGAIPGPKLHQDVLGSCTRSNPPPMTQREHRRPPTPAPTAILRAAILLGLGLSAALAGCGGAQESEAPPQPLAQKTVDMDRYSGVTEAQTVLISDATAWQDLWARHKREQDPVPRKPSIDFSQQMVVAVFAGERPDTCAAVTIQKVYRANNRLVVEYTEPPPDPAAVCSALTTHPAQLVAIPRGPGPVEFIKNTPR